METEQAGSVLVTDEIVQKSWNAYWATLDKHGVEPKPRAAMRAALEAVADDFAAGVFADILRGGESRL